ncbi:MAG TPA: CRISPR-associated endonuclease Cas2 [Patescibacteria group bacterium]|nr:CRISPR-associated endonuclease Cas2 [Patescibacteria group bacterium]
MEKRFGNKKRIILLFLTVLGAVPVAGAITGIIGFWAAHELMDDEKRWKRAFYELERDDYIQRRGKAKKQFYKISKAGDLAHQRLEYYSLRIEKPQSWDHVIRVITFDISVEKKNVRRKLRAALKRLGFVRLQQSVYAHKYPCLQQIKYITKTLSCENNVLYFESTNKEIIAAYKKILERDKEPSRTNVQVDR